MSKVTATKKKLMVNKLKGHRDEHPWFTDVVGKHTELFVEWYDFAKESIEHPKYGESEGYEIPEELYLSFAFAMVKLANSNQPYSQVAKEGPSCSEDRMFYRAWMFAHRHPAFWDKKKPKLDVESSYLEGFSYYVMMASWQSVGALSHVYLLWAITGKNPERTRVNKSWYERYIKGKSEFGLVPLYKEIIDRETTYHYYPKSL